MPRMVRPWGRIHLTTEHTEEHGKNEDLVSGIREPVGRGQTQDAGDEVDSQSCGEDEVIWAAQDEVYAHFVLLIVSHDGRTGPVGSDRPLEPYQDILTESRE